MIALLVLALVSDGVLTQLAWIPETDAQVLSAALGSFTALAALAVRHRHSTESAAFYLLAVVLLALSPLTVRVLGIDPWFFFGGLLVGQTLAIALNYVLVSVSGDPTGVEAFRTVAHRWIDRIRDRRRTVRRRLEAILDRKTIIAVLVGMPLSELVKVTVVQAFAAEPIQWHLAWAHVALMGFGLTIGIHWQRIKHAAEDAGDHAEEMVEGDKAD